ncbi:Copia protein [Eumeta japonica]|uniref:Copia protein n=1 Tax=Eumeta variegata TaxID=151549 RepID=A0A4C1WCN2_EUMVA|nr:Copia protein [Eumeta japonica]
MDETLIKTTVSESDDSLLSCNNDDPTYEPSQEIEDIMSHRNITLRPRNNRRFEANLVELSLPQTYDEALQSPQKYEWSQAIKEELSAHKENNTWNAVPRAGQRTLTTKWVFTIKKGENNEAHYKARLCARGFTQIKDVDYQEIFSPTTSQKQRPLLSTTEAEFVASCETAKEILWLQQLLLELGESCECDKLSTNTTLVTANAMWLLLKFVYLTGLCAVCEMFYSAVGKARKICAGILEEPGISVQTKRLVKNALRKSASHGWRWGGRYSAFGVLPVDGCLPLRILQLTATYCIRRDDDDKERAAVGPRRPGDRGVSLKLNGT